MNWLNKVVDEALAAKHGGEIIIESGVSPSGNYHMGYLREIIICDALLQEIKNRGRRGRHIHFVDDLDGFRKVPKDVTAEYEKYLGQPLADMPAPDKSSRSYADFRLDGFFKSLKNLGVEVDVQRSHEKYRTGFFIPAIEKALQNISEVQDILERVSGRKFEEQWSPIQVNEDGYLKKRPFISINTDDKTLKYQDKDGNEQQTSYAKGEVKLDWRIDWPARWWLLKVDIEPSGRDHSTKGGSFDTGTEIIKKIFDAKPPLPLGYNFINRAGDTKKMSASVGTGIDMSEVVEVLPPEIVRYFILRTPPDKLISFDPQLGLTKLLDDYAALLAKPHKTKDEQLLIKLSQVTSEKNTISSIPFTHLVASYQAALKDPDRTIETLSRTEHAKETSSQTEVIKNELHYIDRWLLKWAPEEVKFSLVKTINAADFDDAEKKYLKNLADKISKAPPHADGDWYHKAIYEFGENGSFPKAKLFSTLYKALIGKDYGPRAGWFLSILPKDWLIKRLKLVE